MAFDFSSLEQPSRAPSRRRPEGRLRGIRQPDRNDVAVDEHGGFGEPVPSPEVTDQSTPDQVPVETIAGTVDATDEVFDESVPDVSPDTPENFELDTADDFDQFYENRKASAQMRLESVPLDDDQRHTVWDALDLLKEETQYAKQEMLDNNGDVSEVTVERIQIAYEALEDVVDDMVEAASEETEQTEVETEFDPNQYIVEQFAEHPYLIPSQRAPVYSLQREYKRAVREGATKDATELATQIKEYVDELVGNDAVTPEGVGTDLTHSSTGRRLHLEVLDDDAAVISRVLDRTQPSDSETLDPLLLTQDMLDQGESETIDPATDGEESESTVASTEQAAETTNELTESLYGMQVPTADSANYTIASFREGVKVAMDHDPDLPSLPGKRALFNELIRLIDYIPDGGMDQDMAEQLHDLVYKINDPTYAAQEIAQTESEQVDDVSQSEVRPTNVPSFAPESVQSSVSPREKAREAVKLQEQKKQQISEIEGFKGGSFFSTILNGASPYESLGDRNFDELFTDALSAGARRAEFLALLKDKSVDQSVFDQWLDVIPEIEDHQIETSGKTFKQVADELIQARLNQR